MPNIRPISDLRNKANEISEFCYESREPVFITNYAKLAEAEEEIVNGAEGEDFFEVAKKLRNSVHRQV